MTTHNIQREKRRSGEEEDKRNANANAKAIKKICSGKWQGKYERRKVKCLHELMMMMLMG